MTEPTELPRKPGDASGDAEVTRLPVSLPTMPESVDLDLEKQSSDEVVDVVIRMLEDLQSRMLTEAGHVRAAIRILRSGGPNPFLVERDEGDDDKPDRDEQGRGR